MMGFGKIRRAPAVAPAALGLGLLALATLPGLATAGMPLQAQVTGQVSSVEGTTAVRIGGTTYLIAPNSPAAQDIRTVTAGETVGLVLNGPPGSPSSEVIHITHTAAGRGSR